MSSGIRDVSLAFGSQVATLVLGLGIQSALAWWLGTGGRGSYAACVVFITILNVLFVVGFDVAIEVFVASRRFSVSEGLTFTFLCGVLSGGIAVAAGLIALQWPLGLLEKATQRQFLLALAWMPVGMVAAVLSRFPAAMGRFGLAAIVQIGQALLQLAMTLILVAGFGAGVEGAIAAGLVTNLVVAVAVPVILRREAGGSWAPPSLEKLREIWSFGVRYYLGKVSNLATVEFGTVIVAMFVSKDEIGVFAVACALAARAEFIPNVLSTVILPRVASGQRGRPELVAQSARVTAVTCVALLGVLVLFTNLIVSVIFSPAFLPAVPLIRIIAVGTLVRCASKLVVPYLISRNRPGLASAAVFAGMVVNLVTMLTFLGTFGLPAAAVGVTLNHLVSSVILLEGFHRASGIPRRRFWTFAWSDWDPVRGALARARPTTGSPSAGI